MVCEMLTKEEERANLCIACGECLEKCPQQIEIPDWLTKAIRHCAKRKNLQKRSGRILCCKD